MTFVLFELIVLEEQLETACAPNEYLVWDSVLIQRNHRDSIKIVNLIEDGSTFFAKERPVVLAWYADVLARRKASVVTELA